MNAIARTCAAALALVCAGPISAKSNAHNGWQCEVEGDWMRVYYEPGPLVMEEGFTLASPPARPVRFSFGMLIGTDVYGSAAIYSLQLDDSLKVASGAERFGVYLYDIVLDGQKIVTGSREAGIEDAMKLSRALKGRMEGTLNIVLRDTQADYGSYTLPLAGFNSAGKAASDLFRSPRDKTAVIACP